MMSIRYATEAVTPSLARINVDAFRGKGMLENIFPAASVSEQQMLAYKTLRTARFLADENYHVLSAEDSSSGQIVGYARWLIPSRTYSILAGRSQSEDERDPRAMPVLSEEVASIKDMAGHAPPGMNVEGLNALKAMMEEKKGKVIDVERDMVLELIGISNQHQRRGLGSQMLEWGIERANRAGVRIYLEATEAGYPLYLRRGWTVVDELVMDWSPYGGKGVTKLTMMVKEPEE
ncbi:hypothetical protein ASPZODRAFT_128925 [Penicilliopsis zonata CBS 506.65]|uniref:N-acetyltransferase domain-containing protein n=1 Tax=Penicilliopsis zonata CBS 506.65 TaxID=1073090 RepID=A0A1L9SSW9_9EURO|nr:hypothetical protein ASPZODRAFT_128925 [Penicilliopsis zonata CBS 506.65]OJJ50305.1 hypothetical protein ASPZODRAFT_128925 [Penicilliopsis zonata CBS 506.65]